MVIFDQAKYVFLVSIIDIDAQVALNVCEYTVFFGTSLFADFTRNCSSSFVYRDYHNSCLIWDCCIFFDALNIIDAYLFTFDVQNYPFYINLQVKGYDNL